MNEQLETLRKELEGRLASIRTGQDLEAFRVKYLSRKGVIAGLFEELKSAAPEAKRLLGQQINRLRDFATQAYGEHKARIEALLVRSAPAVDVTLPGRRPPVGHQHVITRTIDEIKTIFVRMGFDVATGPEMESDYYNFGALNFPPDHPARDMQDTFFIADEVLLRTHTSPVQIRVMERQQPPVRVIMPGKCFRNEVISTRSHVQFHQIEGLSVDAGVTFADLKGTLVAFARQFYGSALKYRFRASFFPFTEPSAEMDITCYLCNGTGCRVCKNTGWLEILGCGMVDPNVFRAVGYDPDAVSGYAFGMGIERVAMLRTGIDDIRILLENDLRVLRQFH